MNNKIMGKLGEEAAQNYLKKQGIRVIEINYRNKYGEIDIIAKEKDTIIFAEVKSRSSIKYGFPCEAVNIKKQQKIKTVALFYLQNQCIKKYKIRFDVIEVYFDENRKTVKDVKFIRNAF